MRKRSTLLVFGLLLSNVACGSAGKRAIERVLAEVRGDQTDSSGAAVVMTGVPHVEPSPTEPSGNVQPVADLPAALRPEECADRAGTRRNLEPSSLKVKGTIIGAKGPVAMMMDGRQRSQVVRRGDYLGTHCARVTEITPDWVTVESQVTDGSGAARTRSTRLYINEETGH